MLILGNKYFQFAHAHTRMRKTWHRNYQWASISDFALCHITGLIWGFGCYCSHVQNSIHLIYCEKMQQLLRLFYLINSHFNSLAPGIYGCNLKSLIFNLITRINEHFLWNCPWGECHRGLMNSKYSPTLVRVMVWYLQTTSHYLSQCWPRCMSPYNVTGSQWDIGSDPPSVALIRLFRRRSKKTSKLRVTGLCARIHRWPVNSPHKGTVTRKCFHLMTSSWIWQMTRQPPVEFQDDMTRF